MERPWYKFYEEGVPKEVDCPKVPLTKFLEESAFKFPNHTACLFFGKQITYSELAKQVSLLAGGLKRLGIKKGSRVSIHLPNCPQFVISFYAVLKLGGIVVQTNPLFVERELTHILNDSGAETIITLDLLYPRITKVKEETSLKNIIVTSIKDFLPFPLSILYPLKAHPPKIKFKAGVKKFSRLLKREEETESVGNPEDIALFQYTGGTTGTSKGVILTHSNLVVNTIQTASWLIDKTPGEEVILAVIPFFHVYGMTTAMNLGIYLGSTLILVPKFETEQVLKLIQKYKPTLFPGVPAIYMALNEHPNVTRYNLKSIKACISGAAPLPTPVKERFESLTGAKLVEGYGLSEASPVTHANPIKGLNKPGSIGIPFPGTDALIVDIETGTHEVSLGEPGELLIRGPQVMKGYWNMEEETEHTIRDGWLYTGDIVKMDEDGYFYIVDRKKELILSASGFNVYPREIEEVLYTHPKIKEAAVVGIPSEERGEVIKAFIVLKESATEEEIKDFCKERLAKYKVPEIIEFKDSLPKSIIGKVLKRVLLEQEKHS
ncbi:TPA: long-chain fatty acid--CoA ligase [bacterium]|nr:long-chain fatty acid--CoA ligase [bacterium]